VNTTRKVKRILYEKEREMYRRVKKRIGRKKERKREKMKAKSFEQERKA
jgi:hypothetical protein